MPLTTIDIRCLYTETQEVSIIEAVQKALVESLKLPADDRDISLRVHCAYRMIVSAQLAKPEQRTVVTVDMFPGRSVDAKRRLYQAIVSELESCEAKIPRDHVLIRLNDLPFENWGIRGGQAACDVELGFQTDV